MKVYGVLWLRGFAIVCCTAMNVVNISQHHWTMAFVTGGAISLVWRWNARNAVKLDTLVADLCYAAGAACGTVFGMGLAGLLKG
jgi:hypothetical protein